MPVSDINTLRNSKIVKRIIQSQVDSTGDVYVLKVRAELVNGWLLHYWEHGRGKIRRYSFHVLRGSKMVVRWDNAPHHPEVKSFPPPQARRKNDRSFKGHDGRACSFGARYDD